MDIFTQPQAFAWKCVTSNLAQVSNLIRVKKMWVRKRHFTLKVVHTWFNLWYKNKRFDATAADWVKNVQTIHKNVDKISVNYPFFFILLPLVCKWTATLQKIWSMPSFKWRSVFWFWTHFLQSKILNKLTYWLKTIESRHISIPVFSNWKTPGIGPDRFVK